MQQTPDVNPYQAPKAQLDVPVVPVAGGSLEDALAGRYDFTMGEVMSEAWRLTAGFKASFWGAAIVIYLIAGVASAIVMAMQRLLGPVVGLVLNLAVSALMTPLSLGLFMMAVRRAAGQPVNFGTAFGFFDRGGTAIAAMLLTSLLAGLAGLLLLLPGIYLGVAYIMTSPLIGDRRLGAWQAMETSRKAITHHWWKVFGLLLVVGLIVLSVSVFLIPLIWAAPWAMMVMGVLYRRIFGTAEDATGVAPQV